MKTICWDIDDCLNNFMFDWFYKKWKMENKDCIMEYEDLKKNPPHEILKCTKEKYLKSLDEFRPDYYMLYHPEPRILKWFWEYGDKFNHIALTGIPLSSVHFSAAWLFKNFGKWIRGYFFVPSYRKNENISMYYKTKCEYINQIGNVDIFIEDNEKNYEEMRGLGKISFLVNRPWNSSSMSIENILRLINKEI